MKIHIIILIFFIISCFASIIAWLNTHTILKELSEIKRQLGIKEYSKPSIFDNDLDKD